MASTRHGSGTENRHRHDLLDMAETLEKRDASILADYQTRTEQSAKTIQDWMDAETWFTATEASEVGFIVRVFTSTHENTASVSDGEHRTDLQSRRERRLALIERL